MQPNVMPPTMPSQSLTPRRVSLHLLLTIFLGFGMLLFGVLAVLAYSHDHATQANHDAKVAAAQQTARAAQKKADDAANLVANEKPYRTYTADAVFGGFELQIPKNWSLYAGKNSGSDTPLDLIGNPEVVNQNLASSAVNTYGLELQLLAKTPADVVKTYQKKIKAGTLTSKGTTVSGIQATQLEGTIDDNSHNGIVVILPVRDKTMVISTDTHDFISEFNAILNSAKITP